MVTKLTKSEIEKPFDKKILDTKYSTSTAVANNNLEGSEPVYETQ